MYLKRLELLGFKSFASKTVLELDRGVTAVVGPNGSGKSNVVDAVRWALGEQSLRAVRSRKSEEVIYAGNARRAGTGMAEVSLVFDNSSGTLPLAFSEVSVSRRIYRSGEGEYLINRSRARLKDVLEVMSHASLGPDAYAVVGQGAVDEVLLQRPEERRALLETAADISRYQAKLQESLSKLSETMSNVQRAEDIKSEITPQLNRLRIQASRASKYEEVRRKLRAAMAKQYLLQIREARERAENDAGQERSRAAALLEATSRQEAAQRHWNALRDESRAAEAKLEAARERVSGLRQARSKAEREAALLQERKSSYERQLAEAEEERDRTERELRELRAEMDGLSAERAAFAAKESEARERLDAIEAEWRRVSSDQRVLQGQLERAIRENQTERSRRSDLEGRRASLQRDLRKAEESLRESVKAAEEATARLGSLEIRASDAGRELEETGARRAEVEAGRLETERKLAELEGQLEAARREERSAWESEGGLRNRLSLLRSLVGEQQGVPPGAKALLEARLPGMRGTLASMLKVPDEYLVAVSAALGGAQAHLVSERFADGLEALSFLAEKRGRGTIAPMRLEKRRPARAAMEEFRLHLNGVLEGIGYRGLAAELVEYPPEAEELCARYLGLSLVVDGMQDALELYRRLLEIVDGMVPFQVVTLDGRLLRSRGDMASTRSEDAGGDLLARQAEMASVVERWERARDALTAAKERVASLEGSRKGLSREMADAASAVSKLQPAMGRLRAEVADLGSQVAKAEAAIEWHRSRGSVVEKELAQSREALSKVERELSDGESRGSSVRARIEQLQGDVAEEQSRVSEVATRRSRIQSELFGAQGRARELGARVAAVSESIQRAEGRVKRHVERAAELAAEMEQIGRGQQAPFSTEDQQELEATEAMVRETAARIASLKEVTVAAEGELSAASRGLEAAREELGNARSAVHESSVELSALVREAARDLEVEGEESYPRTAEEMAVRLEEAGNGDAQGLPEELPALGQRVESLRKQLASIGAINAEAPEEYRAVSERHAFLTAQLDDLRQAERSLRGAIEELRGAMEERFQQTFERVNEEFGRYFTTLFGGGSARLTLTRPDEPLDGGVEVVAVVPGRRASSLLGLSGGERALTAISLLFAMMKVNPSPFCVLDEVDAALDESNVRRFCTVLQDLATNTQFLVITHNRTTMEMAGALYGVTMGSDSVSTVMSVRLASKESLS